MHSQQSSGAGGFNILSEPSKSEVWKNHARLIQAGRISFRTSEKFLFTSPRTSSSKFAILYFIFGNYYELTCCLENSVDTDQLASSEAS